MNKEQWINQQLGKMDLSQRIAQLIHVPAWSNRGSDHQEYLLKLVENYKIGGLIFFQGTPEKQLEMTRELQKVSSTPLMISIDAEWGLGMRLKNSPSFPYHLTMGALEEDEVIYEAACEIARHCQYLGIHVNFAPVVDINSNPDNPVIGFRSFGDDKTKVTQKALAYMRGLQDHGILACAKHFPGHGDTHVDSHLDLPTVDKSPETLKNEEWYPYSTLIEEGLGSIMMGHLFMPQIDNRPNRPSSISKPVIDLLRTELEFQGLLFTDALDMKGIANHFGPGQIELEALHAGNDVLLFVKNVPLALQSILSGIEKGIISEEIINQKCRKLLNYKYELIMKQKHNVQISELQNLLFSDQSTQLNEQIAKRSLTFLGDLPNFDPRNICTVAINLAHQDASKKELAHHDNESEKDKDIHQLFPFQSFLANLSSSKSIKLSSYHLHGGELDLNRINENHDLMILSIHNLNVKNVANFGLTDSLIQSLSQIIQSPKVILVLFGSPYILKYIGWKEEDSCPVVLAYQENEYTQKSAASFLFDIAKAEGKIPVQL